MLNFNKNENLWHSVLGCSIFPQSWWIQCSVRAGQAVRIWQLLCHGKGAQLIWRSRQCSHPLALSVKMRSQRWESNEGPCLHSWGKHIPGWHWVQAQQRFEKAQASHIVLNKLEAAQMHIGNTTQRERKSQDILENCLTLTMLPIPTKRFTCRG